MVRSDEHSDWVVGQFHYIELNRCPDQEQGKFPDKRSLYPFFFFGPKDKDKKSRQWIKLQNTVGPVESKDWLTIKNEDGSIKTHPFERLKKFVKVPIEDGTPMKASFDHFWKVGPYHDKYQYNPEWPIDQIHKIHATYLACENMDIRSLAHG